MKVLVTGGNGQLAYDVKLALDKAGIDYKSIDFEDADITNEKEIKNLIRDYAPDAIIHCAAYTAVDQAEDDKEKVEAINVLGTRYIAEASKEIDAKLVYISTDYVFDGEGTQPFEVTDTPNPVSWYGITKYQGELEVQKVLEKYFIVRISWVFGVNGNNFVKTMLRLGNERDSLNVVNDQIGSPTYCGDVAPILVDMIQTEKYGIYHATNEGFCSWYDFTQKIFEIANINCEVKGIPTREYPTRAVRPLNSRMSKQSLIDAGFTVPRKWEEALEAMIELL
ncbi:NAD(P)-dependent oxidoreductase [Erysipelothrix larvae]|uniref:dTDP-4-dehydrorhamnose reductase n=2 Tax=Erysipelothrix larvae TaxID=1514105 RepID=A0A0X8H0V1_9FIRM|nr:NAD(P)-dependent oxidoreductase [Erysipelothrix larvae]